MKKLLERIFKRFFVEKLYPNGIICSCTKRIYKNRISLKKHFDTEVHTKFLKNYTFDGIDNPISKIIQSKQNEKNQQILITRLSNENTRLSNEITRLSNEINKLHSTMKYLKIKNL